MIKRFLVGIVILAAIVRLFRLGSVPLALEWDEVALGYDANSILHTARDQFNKILPFTFRSLDDYKPPMYEYAAVPSIALFGLTQFATRLPSAVSGIIAVFGVFFLAMELFRGVPSLSKSRVRISLITSFLLAISPWHLQFSRAAFEVNVSIPVTIGAVYLFLIGRKNPKLFYLSALLFGLDLFSYHSTRVISPILLLLLFFLFNRTLPSRKILGTFIGIYALFVIAVTPILLSPDAQIRFTATNIFTPGARYLDEKDLPKQFLNERLKDANAGYEFAGKLFHNSRLVFTDYDTLKKAFSHYISNFGFEYLFITGDAPLHHPPGFGLLYIFELPFLIFGILYILIKRINKASLFILFWLFLGPLTDAVTREAPHAVRTEVILPTYQLLTAVGIVAFNRLLKNQSPWIIHIISFFFCFLFTMNIAFYFHQYYVHTNYELSKNWMYGRSEAVKFTEQHKSEYDKIFVSIHLEMPHMFWLFYSNYPPGKYLSQGGTVSGGFEEERNHYDNYYFKNFNYREKQSGQKILYVGTPKDFPSDVSAKETIYYLNGEKAIVIAE